VRASTRKYITSEQFIHDDLMLRCSAVMEDVYRLWKRDKRIDAGILAWPDHDVPDDDGRPIAGIIRMQLPEDPKRQQGAIRNLIRRVDPYGIFIIRQEPGRIYAVLETPKGTRTWTIPIERSADVRVLGKTHTQDAAGSAVWIRKGK